MQASGRGRKWGHYTPSPAAFANEMLRIGAGFRRRPAGKFSFDKPPMLPYSLMKIE